MRLRHVLVCLGLLAFVSLGCATAAVAQGGSAGDQQYTDPFGSTKTSSQTSTQPQGTTPSTTPATTTSAPSGTAAATTTPTATSGSYAGTPAATAASDTSSSKTLPFTGINVWTVAGLGLTLTAAGLLIRLRSRA
jgi:cytoskeletal protein RodZ